LPIPFSPEQEDRLEQLGRAMVADPLYPSVSKIFSPEDIALKHFLDSLVPLSLPLPCWQSQGTILDLGTGGGFPSMPLAIALPGRTVIAVDSKGKSVDFVERMKTQCGLTNLMPRQGRAEELGQDPAFREDIDLVVCRAVAAVRILLELCLPLVKVGGHLLMYKGPKCDLELQEAQKALQVLGVSRKDCSVHQLEPPAIPFSRSFILIRKEQSTVPAYPRRNGIPNSTPL
jgi:16S rRNA (guanine527-N7)-methyltransferase